MKDRWEDILGLIFNIVANIAIVIWIAFKWILKSVWSFILAILNNVVARFVAFFGAIIFIGLISSILK